MIGYGLLYWILSCREKSTPCDWMSPELKVKKLGPHCYQVEEAWWCLTGIKGAAARLVVGHILVAELRDNGFLIVHPGFVFDGPSGPTVDTPASLVFAIPHDALYRMARERKLDPSLRHAVDDLADRCGRQAGMYEWRLPLWHQALRKAAGGAWSGEPEPEIVVK